MNCFLLILATLLLSISCSDIGLRVSPSRAVSQPSSQQFVVTCRGFGASPALFSNNRWYDPRGQQIDSFYSQRINADIRVEETEGALLLHFLNPRADDSGRYRCAATFQHSDSLETHINVTFFQDVQWEDCPRVQSLVLGASHERIRCKASADPKPNIIWTKDDNPLDSRFQIDANGIALNDIVRLSDGGLFKVRALVTETGRLHEAFITVQVFEKPRVNTLPERFEATDSEQTTLQCDASGRPRPLFSWLDPNKRNLSSVGGYSVDRNTGSLIISRVRQRDDSGLFTCIAENEAGIDKQTTTLVVWRRPKVTSFANVSQNINLEAILECRATGDPRPQLSIRRDGDSRALEMGDPRVSLDLREERDETVLRATLSQIQRSDDNLYFCRANNRGGVGERAGHLEVRFAPDLSRTQTSIRFWDSKLFNISCIADAIPNATIRWWFRGAFLQNDDVFRIHEKPESGVSTLVVDSRAQREVSGIFRCISSNALGTKELNIEVERAYRPAAVLLVQEERTTATTITFRVSAPTYDGGLPINRIHCKYSRDSRDSEVFTRFWARNPKEFYFLDSLKPKTKYRIQFAAENSVGIGDYSLEKYFSTQRESTPARPEFHNIPKENALGDIVSPFADQFQVSWSLPEDNGRRILSFEIQIYEVKKSDFGFERTSHPITRSLSMSDQSMTSFTARDLNPNTLYKLEVRAINELGSSETSSVVFRTSNANQEETSREEQQLSKSASLALISGIAIALIVILLIISDIFFCARYRVGAIHFLSRNVFVSRRSASSAPKSIENRAFSGRPPDDPLEPFVGRASAV